MKTKYLEELLGVENLRISESYTNSVEKTAKIEHQICGLDKEVITYKQRIPAINVIFTINDKKFGFVISPDDITSKRGSGGYLRNSYGGIYGKHTRKQFKIDDQEVLGQVQKRILKFKNTNDPTQATRKSEG